MGLIARQIEAVGIPTLSMTSALSITRAVHPPRGAFLDYPLGHTTGKANEPGLQVEVANVERKMPRNYISADGFGITAAAKRYLAPLIEGEDYPRYKNGLPQYVELKNQLVPQKLKPFKV